jgi:hypothetical protein
VIGEVTFAENSAVAWAMLHIRLPSQRVQSVDAESRASVAADGSGIRWSAPRGKIRFQATIAK